MGYHFPEDKMIVHMVEHGRDDPIIVGVFSSVEGAMRAVADGEPDKRKRFHGDWIILALDVDGKEAVVGNISWSPEDYSNRNSPIVLRQYGVYDRNE
jgi:hypothetical protein